MEPRARVALGVAGGYLLGRTKKLKLALTVGGMVAGRKLGTSGMLGKGLDVVTSSPEFGRLRKQVGGVGKAAAVSAASKSLRQVTQRIEAGGDEQGEDGRDEREDQPRERAERPAQSRQRGERSAQSRQRGEGSAQSRQRGERATRSRAARPKEAAAPRRATPAKKAPARRASGSGTQRAASGARRASGAKRGGGRG